MGADLYRTGHDAIQDAIHPIFEAACTKRDALPQGLAHDEAQKEVNAAYDAMYPPTHYFRDSYNNSSLFWKLDLSWWQDLDPFYGPDGNGVQLMERDEDGDEWPEYKLYPAGMRRLIAEVESRRDVFHANIADESPEDQEYFRTKLSRFTAFLHDAAEAGDTISCSV